MKLEFKVRDEEKETNYTIYFELYEEKKIKGSFSGAGVQKLEEMLNFNNGKEELKAQIYKLIHANNSYYSLCWGDTVDVVYNILSDYIEGVYSFEKTQELLNGWGEKLKNYTFEMRNSEFYFFY